MRKQAVLHAAQEDERKLQALGGVQRHHLHAVFPLVGLVLAGFEHRVREEVRERRHLCVASSGSKPRAALTSSFRFSTLRFAAIAAFLLVVRDQAARIDDVVDLLVQRQGARLAIELLDEQQERVQALAAARAELGDAGAGRLPHRAGIGARVVAHGIERLRADAAGRQVHDALERGVVGAIEDQPQVGERILDFSALEESQAAVHAIRNARREQRLFERARLRVRAVQNRAVAAPPAFVRPVANAVDDEVGFVALVECGVQADRIAALAARPQVLAEPARCCC